MGKITKTMQPKHKETLSPWLKSYVETASTTPLPLLPKQLANFPTRWPFGRGDLYHWIALLNRFDSILEQFCVTYQLNAGPQPREFGRDLLLDHTRDAYCAGDRTWDATQLTELGFAFDGDRQLVESILKFTRMLLEHCGNRSIYASSSHLNDLLNSTSLPILIATLEVGSELAQRYQASVKRIGNASRQISAALLANHYNIDIDRVQQLALPFQKTPLVSLSESLQFGTPGSTLKGKEKPQQGNRNAASMHANDLLAVATADDTRWSNWGDVRVSYYPQDEAVAPTVAADHGRPSLPSTPTPLRRSSTMTTHHVTPRSRNHPIDDSSPVEPRTPGLGDGDSPASGQKWFDIPQASVISTPIYDLVSRCPPDMPEASKYEVFHRLRVADALTKSQETRQQLLALRLLAITNLAYILTESNFVERVLRHDMDETRRYQLVYQLAELVHPSTSGKTDVPLWLQTIALALLEAISGFQARCQDVLSALNANVNHGILLYVIRKAVAGMKEDDDTSAGEQVTEADQWRNNLFSLTLYLSMSTRAGSEMVSVGLMDILVDMLNIRSNIAQRHQSMVLAFLDSLIWTYQNAFTAFFNANGLNAVAALVVDTVNEAQTLRKSGRGVTTELQSNLVDYEIPYYQQQTLKWLLKFIHHVMSNSFNFNGNTDRLLRNLAEKSDLLASLRDIIGEKKTYGSVVWTNSVTILSDFINNDPTSFAAISESGMIKTFLEAITGRPVPDNPTADQKRDESDDDDESESSVDHMDAGSAVPDDRPHPPPDELLSTESREILATGILPSPDAINVVPQVLNSISLNNAGMRLVIDSRAFDSLFEIFESPEHVKCMEGDENLANNVGGSFDELARHHPVLRVPISNAVIDMVARVRFLGLEKARTAGWGAKLLVTGPDSHPPPTTARPQDNEREEASHPTGDRDPSDHDVDMADAVSPRDAELEATKTTLSDSKHESISPYIHALASFLSAYLTNTTLKSQFIERGGIELLLDICESPSLPASFGDSMASRILNSVVSQLIEHCPVQGLPSLLKRARSAISVLQPLAAKTEPLPPFFAPFLTPEGHGSRAELTPESVATGTNIVKALLNAQTFIKIISDCFATQRSYAQQFYPVNVYDYYLDLVKAIGPVLRGVLAEEAGQLTVVPQHWSFRRQGPLAGGPLNGSPVDADADGTLLPDVLNHSEGPKSGEGSEHAQSRPSEQEQASNRYRNYDTLRILLHPMIPTVFPLFQSLGKALLPRRELNHGNLYVRCRHIEIAKALAETVLGHLRSSVTRPDPSAKEFHYWIIMLHTIHEMLVDHPRHGDRGNLQIILPVLLAFKEQGGLDVLESMLGVFTQSVLRESESNAEDTSKSKVAAFGLKKILDLYLTLVNGKYITDASGSFSLLRQMDRTQPISNVPQQIVVEFRAAVLSAVMHLWEPAFMEKVPTQTVKRLLAILKTISMADLELQNIPKDKPMFNLFNYTDTRFDWAGARTAISELTDSGLAEDLVHEAVYRANSNVAAARDYCRAHMDGTAGSRNPIPPEDSDKSALTDVSVSGDRPQSSTEASASEADRMSLDTPAEFPGGILGGLVDQPAQAVEEGTAADDTPSKPDAGEESSQAVFTKLKQELGQSRAKLLDDFVSNCLDVIRLHPETATDVSDLITAAVLRQKNPGVVEDVATTLAYAFTSLSAEDEEEIRRNGKYIASYAHLLAMLLQDDNFFEHMVEILRDRVDEFVSFIGMGPPKGSSELPPWTPFMLLVVEILLCHDERPVAAQWKPPKTLNDSVTAPVIEMRPRIVSDEQRMNLLNAILDLFARVGQEEMLATAILRVLVILTRQRELAKLLGDKKNLQRLFLMAKQLSSTGSERMKQAKVPTHIMTILRHIVEDDEMIKQIMRTEIKTDYPSIQRSHRTPPDVGTYLRSMAHVALRAPDLFVEVTNELLRFERWSASNGDNGRSPPLVWKEQETEASHTTTTVPETSTPPPSDVKESTETVEKDAVESQKQPHEIKRPVVEIPEGVIHFLLGELLTYREVEDKEPTTTDKDAKAETQSSAKAGEAPSKTDTSPEEKDKKQPKAVFKTDEHPIFVYRCFLLNCVTELLSSYNRTKVEFINYKRGAPPVSANTPVKPRSSVLNYLIYDLLCQGNLSGATDSIASKKKAATSSQTQKLLVALVTKTSERVIDRSQDKFVYDDEPDLLYVRKFVLDTILKAYERAPISEETLEVRYSRMQCLAELMNCMVGEKEKEASSNTRNADNTLVRSQAQLRRLMYEKGYLDKLTSSIAEINLNYPGVKRAIKYILRVLRFLTDTAKELSHSNILTSDSAGEIDEDDFASASSPSDLDDEREETPDLYRNSTLGMLEPRGEDDESEDDSEDDDEDMYGDDYDEEMDYGDEDISDGEDNISDDDEVLSEMGEIEGLPGEPGVVEVIMDDDDDDDDDDDEDDDEEDEEDEDDIESADMEDADDRVEIVDQDGVPVSDDGNSAWESDSDADDDDDPEAAELDYEADVQDEHEAHLHGLGSSGLLDSMARAMMVGDDFEPDMMEGFDDEHFIDDGHDDDENEDDDDGLEDEEYIYDEDYRLDDPLSQIPALGWDGLNPDLDDRRQIFLLDAHNRRQVLARMDNRSPLPPRFMAASTRDNLSNFRSFFSRSHRANVPQSNAEDGVNPLLRRSEQGQNNATRPGQPLPIGLRLHDSFLPGGNNRNASMGLLGDLMELLPMVGRHNQHVHLHITGPGGPSDIRDLGAPRLSRSEQRRDTSTQEPHHAVAFQIDSTMNRYQEEMRMIFGSNHLTEAGKLASAISAQLTPAAMELEKKAAAQEAENQKRLDEARRKREEEERLAREAKAAEEKAEKERKEAEEREAASRAAAEAATASASAEQLEARAGERETESAMEGVERTGETSTPTANPQGQAAAPSSEPRVMTMIRGEEVDVTELGIDPDYLAALPEEFREEVIAQTVSSRRSQAREDAATGESTEVFQEFLDALPEDLRMEIVQQERQEQRRRNREDNRRQAMATATGGHETVPTDMDTASILLTFPPDLREQVLIDQGEDLMDQLPPELAAQARALSQQLPPQRRNIQSIIQSRAQATDAPTTTNNQSVQDRENKNHRRAVVQMLDKAGVATLLRLMFVPQHGSARSYLYSVFADVCENRQNRLEVINSILQILQDGSADMSAVERSFGQLSLKAKKQRDKDLEQKTPQSLKRTSTTLIAPGATATNSETSPLLIVHQCLDLLVDLCVKNPHVCWLFLTEHETVGSTLKRSLSRKGKTKDTRAQKFAINSLLSLLDRELVIESSIIMTFLADLLNRVTLPLQNLDRRRKEAEDGTPSEAKKEDGSEPNVSGEQAHSDAMPESAPGSSNQPEQEAGDAGGSNNQKGSSAPKKPRQLQPPHIPAQNLTLVVRIFVARECSSKTFQNTISTIKNLSTIPGAKAIFGQELVHQARLLSENILLDLDSLLPHIEKATSGTEIQGIALAKFSPGASEQNKLLRVLTALDHLFDSKKKKAEAEIEGPESEKQNLVTSLYHNSTFSAMWDKLSACLKAIRKREGMLNVATILLPLIESLMVVCKNTTTNDDPAHNQAGSKEMLLSSPPPEARTASLFFSFTEDHRRILNELVRHNPKLMSGTFALLVKNPKVLEFDNKRNYFNRSIHSRSGNSQNRPSFPPLQIGVRRENVFHDSFRSLFFLSGDELKYGKLNIRFHGEEGVDAGGVTREWFQVLARQMFDPNYVLFTPVSSDRTTFHPNKLSAINDEHLAFFKFIGRVIGKALYEGRVLDCFFSRAVYKRILGKSVSVKDMESFDPDYYKSLCWMLDNDITDIITESFSVEDDAFGATKVVDLIPNGREVPVTEDNKHEYVRLVVEHKLLSSVKEQMENFLFGFHEIIPAELISIFDEQELELLISGLPDIDVDDWKSNTEYHNYSPSSQQIQWFWRAVRSFDKEERAKLLQFVTGTSKVPLNGFKELEGMNGVNRFNIHRDYGKKDRLPTSHTCFNQLDIPEYDSYDVLRSQIMKAITAGSDYFGFA
ncbi:hypothetical protein S7711_05101 [Stachybotrys chartarum IBT 7711]|uniref:HECT-type E3 ubiquitin transferase n=1 Tax=Stachybotrys chartarum (strain CBS 109288 / IBT 7711) TaxID=1280523 RepID=A0A084ANV2_STACB|nr:hypothetical protein S7711_05101 [Stachybotrys chartarum IBT 7711]